MTIRTMYIYGFLLTICIAILFAAQYAPPLMKLETETFMTFNGVKGIAVEQNKKLWTLNFNQQNDFIAAINSGHEIGKELFTKDASLFPYTKIIIYQFDKPNLVLTPINISNGDIISQAPEIITNGYLKEGSSGKLNEMLKTTFDS